MDQLLIDVFSQDHARDGFSGMKHAEFATVFRLQSIRMLTTDIATRFVGSNRIVE